MKKWLLAVTLITAPAFAQQVPPEIARDCAKKWGTDYEMQVYCRDQQMKALRQLQMQDGSKADTSGGAVNGTPFEGIFVPSDVVAKLNGTYNRDVEVLCKDDSKPVVPPAWTNITSCRQAQQKAQLSIVDTLGSIGREPNSQISKFMRPVTEQCLRRGLVGGRVDRVKVVLCEGEQIQKELARIRGQ
ncbi:hypothetical protein FZC33_00205 [Labrys sp. KNU-23]|uniref:hypothetical protein n=1 Tax=Labrys sp. KNU-23 TaxID=2789216 RepID=UPI0011F003AA|nr:hypothetical protein [Labrys sp. KNU-23]QEN84751.1 hypothetical protein FZC33_00205 [Labrys sp. KNU-23]